MTSSRAFATLLSWLSDHKSPVFVIGTSNDHTRLPTEFVRKGRFDEIFWLDLPSVFEREKIFEVLLARYGRKIEDVKGGNIKKLAEESTGFTGAEIEQAIIGAMYSRFDKDAKQFSQIDLIDEIKAVVPLSKTAADDIKVMREKAAGKLRIVNSSGASRIFEIETSESKRADDSLQRQLNDLS